MFEGLDEVRLDGILQQHRHRSLSLELLRGHRFVVVGIGDDYLREAFLEVLDAL